MIEIIPIIKNEVGRERHPKARRLPTFYPSSASAEHDGIVEGSCWRADWYRIHGVPASDATKFYMNFVWALGKTVEDIQVEAMKTAGMYETNAVKFYDPERNVSGELDIVGRYRRGEEVRYFGAECLTPESLVRTRRGLKVTKELFTEVDSHTEDLELYSNEYDLVSHRGLTQKWNRFYTWSTYEETVVYRLRSAVDGLLCVTTGEHPYLAATDNAPETIAWTPAQAIAPGKHSVFVPKLVAREMPVLDDDEYKLIGLMLGAAISSNKGVLQIDLQAHVSPTDVLDCLLPWVQVSDLESVEIDHKPVADVLTRITAPYDLLRNPFVYLMTWLSSSSFFEEEQAAAIFEGLRLAFHSEFPLVVVDPRAAEYIWHTLAAQGLPARVELLGHFDDPAYLLRFSGSGANCDELLDGHTICKGLDDTEGYLIPIDDVDEFNYEGSLYNFDVDVDDSYVSGLYATHNCKSVYGMGATKTIQGRARAYRGQEAYPPKPKEGNVFQVIIYLDQFDVRLGEDFGLDFFKLTYFPRDKPVDGREYTIVLCTKDNLEARYKYFSTGVNYGSLDVQYSLRMMEDGKRYALIMTDGHPSYVETRYPLEAIYERFAQLKEFVAAHTPPPRPVNFCKFYSAEQIADYHQRGIVSKTALEAWEKKGRPPQTPGVTPGHFLCQSYCDWRSFCFKADGSPNPEADLIGVIGEDRNASAD